MDYTEICKYVFRHEVVDWELHAYKSRKMELVQARQISIYLGSWFYPHITDKDLAGIFGQDHATAQHSCKQVKKYLFSDKEYRAKMDKYLLVIREIIKNEDTERNKKLIEESLRKKLLDTIDSMEIVARLYCDIKGMRLTKIE